MSQEQGELIKAREFPAEVAGLMRARHDVRRYDLVMRDQAVRRSLARIGLDAAPKSELPFADRPNGGEGIVRQALAVVATDCTSMSV